MNPVGPTNVTINPMANKDYTLIIDQSGSMATNDMPGGLTRWKAVAETTFGIASKIVQFDPDGIEVHLFNNRVTSFQNVTPAKVAELFSENDPCGGTYLAPVLEKAMNAFFTRRDADKAKENGEIIIIVTDGEPSDKAEVAEKIINATHRLQPQDKLSVIFVQVGSAPDAKQYLNALDNDLKGYGALRDIVSVVTADKVGEKGLNRFLMDAIQETVTK